jgi:hypothetical protein
MKTTQPVINMSLFVAYGNERTVSTQTIHGKNGTLFMKSAKA